MLSGGQFLDLYHRTTPEAAEDIRSGGGWRSEENPPRAYFSTERDGQGAGYGEGVVHVKLPSHLAELDDEFPGGERHYAVPIERLKPEHLVAETDKYRS